MKAPPSQPLAWLTAAPWGCWVCCDIPWLDPRSWGKQPFPFPGLCLRAACPPQPGTSSDARALVLPPVTKGLETTFPTCQSLVLGIQAARYSRRRNLPRHLCPRAVPPEQAWEARCRGVPAPIPGLSSSCHLGAPKKT